MSPLESFLHSPTRLAGMGHLEIAPCCCLPSNYQEILQDLRTKILTRTGIHFKIIVFVQAMTSNSFKTVWEKYLNNSE